MATSTSLSRLRLAGRSCRRGAWIVAGTGLTIIVYYFISQIPNYQANAGVSLNDLLTSIAIALLIAIPIFSFFLILNAAGILLEYIGAEQKTQEVSDEQTEIIPVPEMHEASRGNQIL